MKKFNFLFKSMIMIFFLSFILSSLSFSVGKKYSISGLIKDKSGAAIADVAVYIVGGKVERVTTDAAGFYKFADLDSGKTFKVTPNKQTHIFDPKDANFNKLNENKTQNFNGSLVQLFSISGFVKDNSGKGVRGVLIAFPGTLNSTGRKAETDSTGFYKIENLEGGKTYTLVPMKTGYTFNPKVATIENLKENKVQDFSAIPPPLYSISGTVKDATGAPIGGVLVSLTGERAGKATTDNSGSYKFDNLPGGKTYIIFPYKTGYTFDPKSKTFENLTENKTQDFTGIASVKYSISGNVKDKDAKPVGGVQMTLFGGSNLSSVAKSKKTITDSLTGNYKFENIESGTYTLIPEKKNYTFNPKMKTFENLNQNQVQDFIAEGLPTFVISGYIKDKSSNPIGGVTVALLGSSSLKATTDNTTGFYKFEKLPGGRMYTIIPSKRGYTFDPKLKTIESLTSDITQDFTGTAAALVTLSGYVLDKSGVPVPDATVRLSGEKQSKDTVDQKGFYQFENLEAGKYYALIPEAKGYSFEPRVKTFEPLTESKTQDFTGTTIPVYTIDGYVKDSAGNALQGTTIKLAGGGNSQKAETDENGYYKIEKLTAGRFYLVMPSKRGYIFTPKYKMIENLSENVTQDFTGKMASNSIGGNSFGGYSNTDKIITGVSLTAITTNSSYSVIGIVQDVDNSFIGNVTVTLNGVDQLKTQTDENGLFIFDNLAEGSSYTLTAFKSGYMFDPSSITYTELSDNQAEIILGESSSTTNIKEINSVLPKDFSLYQNYPNPFNPSTIIRYSLPEHSKLKIGIYDILGREVTTIFNGYQSAGTHEIQFDAKHLSSGKYFVRLQTGNTLKTINILLLK